MRRQQLTQAQITTLLDPPTDQRELVRHYTLSAADLAAIRRCRGDHNRLGHALMLCYLRYPGRPLKAGERPSRALLLFIAEQIDAFPESIEDYLAAERNHRSLSRCPRESHSSLAPSRVRSRVPPVPNFRTGIPGFPALSPRLSWMSAQRQSRHAAAKCGCQGEWPMPKFARIIGESLGAEAAPGLSLPRRPLPFRSYLHRSSLCCTASGRLCRAGIGRIAWPNRWSIGRVPVASAREPLERLWRC
jgi:hypothetical protein